MTREYPILMSPDLALAACRGIKTVTRRVVTPQPLAPGMPDSRLIRNIGTGWLYAGVEPEQQRYGFWLDNKARKCQYGGPGDTLRLLTTWAVPKKWNDYKPTAINAGYMPCDGFWHAGMGDKPSWAGKSRPGRFCPTFLRHLLPKAINRGVTIERLQEIGRDGRKAVEVRAEGISNAAISYWTQWLHPDDAPAHAFCETWDKINRKKPGCSWGDNPFVWRIQFEVTR